MPSTIQGEHTLHSICYKIQDCLSYAFSNVITGTQDRVINPVKYRINKVLSDKARREDALKSLKGAIEALKEINGVGGVRNLGKLNSLLDSPFMQRFLDPESQKPLGPEKEHELTSFKNYLQKMYDEPGKFDDMKKEFYKYSEFLGFEGLDEDTKQTIFKDLCERVDAFKKTRSGTPGITKAAKIGVILGLVACVILVPAFLSAGMMAMAGLFSQTLAFVCFYAFIGSMIGAAVTVASASVGVTYSLYRMIRTFAEDKLSPDQFDNIMVNDKDFSTKFCSLLIRSAIINVCKEEVINNNQIYKEEFPNGVQDPTLAQEDIVRKLEMVKGSIVVTEENKSHVEILDKLSTALQNCERYRESSISR